MRNALTAGLPIDTVIEWVRGVGPGPVEDIIPVCYKGQCDRADEGLVGFDVRVRPVHLGPGEHTCTVSGDAVRLPKRATRAQ